VQSALSTSVNSSQGKCSSVHFLFTFAQFVRGGRWNCGTVYYCEISFYHVLMPSLSTRITIIFQSLSSDPQEPNEKLDNVTLNNMYPHSELDPELDSQNMDQLQLAPSVVILVRMKKSEDSTYTPQNFHLILLHFSSAISLLHTPLSRISNQISFTHTHTHH